MTLLSSSRCPFFFEQQQKAEIDCDRACDYSNLESCGEVVSYMLPSGAACKCEQEDFLCEDEVDV